MIDVAAGHDHCLALIAGRNGQELGIQRLRPAGRWDDDQSSLAGPGERPNLRGRDSRWSGHELRAAFRRNPESLGTEHLGELGDGTTTDRRTPVAVGTLTCVVSVAGGRDHGLAVRSDGTVWAWGTTPTDSWAMERSSIAPRPVQVTGLSGVVAVSAGAFHSVALLRGWHRPGPGVGTTWGNSGTGRPRTVRRHRSVTGLSDVVSIGTGP